MNYIAARFFLHCNNRSDAEKIVSKLIRSVQPYVSAQLNSCEKYWKIKEYYDVSIKLFNKDISRDTLCQIVETLGGNWQDFGDYYIWNDENKNKLIFHEIKWCSLEIIN